MDGRMIKLSDVGEMLRQTAQSLRDSVSGEAHAKAKLASAQRVERAENIVELADGKHIDLSPLVGEYRGDRREKVAALVGRDDLDRIEDAVKLNAGDLAFGQAEDSPRVVTGSEFGETSRAEENFVAALMGDDI